jgi:uncharacterized membrane protein
VGCPFRSGWFANMVSSFAFVVIIYLYSHTAKYNDTEKNNNIIIT